MQLVCGDGMGFGLWGEVGWWEDRGGWGAELVGGDRDLNEYVSRIISVYTCSIQAAP